MTTLWDLLVADVREESRREASRSGGVFVDTAGIVGVLGCRRPLGCYVHGGDADLEWLLTKPGLTPPLFVTDAHPGHDVVVKAGWSVEERLTAMVLPGRSALVPAPAPAPFAIDAVSVPDGIAEFHDAMERGFQGPPGQAAAWLPRELLISERPHLLVARNGREAVGTAGARRRVEGSVLFAISVDPAHRGLGLGAALTAAASAASFDAGARFVSLHATPAGNDVYERVGFRVAGRVTTYVPGNIGSAAP